MTMAKPSKNEKPDTDEERENEVLRRMLNTPPKPHKPKSTAKRGPTEADPRRRLGKKEDQ